MHLRAFDPATVGPVRGPAHRIMAGISQAHPRTRRSPCRSLHWKSPGSAANLLEIHEAAFHTLVIVDPAVTAATATQTPAVFNAWRDPLNVKASPRNQGPDFPCSRARRKSAIARSLHGGCERRTGGRKNYANDCVSPEIMQVETKTGEGRNEAARRKHSRDTPQLRYGCTHLAWMGVHKPD